jgi:hypothetical protein
MVGGWHSAGLAATVVLTVSWLVATFTWPFGWDQGIFAWVGSVIRDGGLPYRDAVDVKGPLPYYVFAWTQVVLGDNTWGIRVVDAGAMIIAAGALGGVVRKLANPVPAIWAACSLILSMGTLGFWGTAQPDGWVAAIMTVSIATLFAGIAPAGPGRVAVAAALAGTTALVKPFYLAFALVPLAYLWTPSMLGGGTSGELSFRRRIAATAAALTAAALPAGLAIGWFAWHGALDSAIDVHFRYTAGSYSGLSNYSLTGRARGLVDLAGRLPALVLALPAIAVGVMAAWRRDRALTAALIGWLVMAAGFVALQGRFYRYQLLPAFPPLVALTTIGFAAVLSTERRAPSRLRVFAFASLALVVFQLIRTPASDTLRAGGYAVGVIPEDRYYGGFAPLPSFNAADQRAMVALLRARSDPGDRVAVLGYNAGVLYLADRRSATRFGLSYPFTHDSNTPLAARFRREFLDAIAADPPEWVLVGAIDGGRLSLERRLQSHPGLAAIITDQYCLVSEIGHYALFRHCENSGNRSRHDGPPDL